MKNNFTFRNHEELVNKLTDLIVDYEVELNKYEEQVYVRVNPDGTGSIKYRVEDWDTDFPLYTDPVHKLDAVDFFSGISDYAQACEMSEQKLVSKVASFYDMDIDNVTAEDVKNYIKNEADYLYVKIKESYEDWVRSDCRYQCEEKAREAVNHAEWLIENSKDGRE